MKRFTFRYLSCCISLCMVTAGAVASFAASGSFTKHFSRTLFGIAEKGQVSIELLLDDSEYKIPGNTVGIVVHDSEDHDVEYADLSVTMKGAGGALSQLKVREEGDGLYTIPKKGLPADGAWELLVGIRMRKIDDRIVFRFPDAARDPLPAGKYSRTAEGSLR